MPMLAAGCFDPPQDTDPSFTPLPTTSAGDGSTTGPDGSTGGSTDLTADTTEGPAESTTSPQPTTDSSSGTTGGDPVCGDGIVDPGEDCDDMGESATCDADCTPAECGDTVINATAMEQCDDGNLDDTDACAACQPASCGDGFLWAGMEQCDDGNLVDLDACNNACTFGTILVSGNANTFLTSAMTALGEAYASEMIEWPAPMSAGVIIFGRNGGSSAPPPYQPHLDAGAHILVFGGSSIDVYANWVAGFLTTDGTSSWHQITCASDYNEATPHPITDLIPDVYEFPELDSSYHMLHLTEAGQPPDTVLLGRTCEPGANNYTVVTRRYPSGGTFTFVAYALGGFGDAPTQADYLEPLLEGYLAYIRSPPP